MGATNVGMFGLSTEYIFEFSFTKYLCITVISILTEQVRNLYFVYYKDNLLTTVVRCTCYLVVFIRINT